MKEELKKAFRKTIARWEKIGDDVNYYMESDCPLCKYAINAQNDDSHACHICPIYKETGVELCKNTPHEDFAEINGQTTENALRELVFLKDLYIELIDCPKPTVRTCVECGEFFDPTTVPWDDSTIEDFKKGCEKRAKEEWVDITKDVRWDIDDMFEDWRLTGCYHESEICFLKADEGIVISGDKSKYKVTIEESGYYFKVLKKEITWK